MASSGSVYTSTLNPALDILQFFLQNNMDSAGQRLNDSPETWALDRHVHCSHLMHNASSNGVTLQPVHESLWRAFERLRYS